MGSVPFFRLAIFDLDGTITRNDTLVPYLRGWLRLHPRRGWRLAAIVALARYLTQGRDRGRLKADLIRACMAGADAGAVHEWSAAFADGLHPQDLCPGALAAIERHRARGDRLILLSASVDLYVPEIGRRLGFDESICTGVAWRDGLLDGALTTPNRRAGEKRRCVEALRERFPAARIAAYANASSDFAHLLVADEPRLVNGTTAARREARGLGIATEDWCNKGAPAAVPSA
jgi:HAD superfamily hydrolase (TIGR01490 family)